MAPLTANKRNALRKSSFGLPGKRSYPMPDASHAANAKARATQQYNKGNLSSSGRAQINAKANRVLGKKGGSPRDALARQMVDQDKRKAAGSQRKMLPARKFGGSK